MWVGAPAASPMRWKGTCDRRFPGTQRGSASVWLLPTYLEGAAVIGFTLRFLGQEVLEFYLGRPADDGTKPSAEDRPPLNSNAEPTFGFVRAGIEFDKPAPESRRIIR